MVPRGRSLRILLLVCLGAWLIAPASSSAATHRSIAWPGCGGGYNSGSFDTAGRTYVPCGNPTTIGVYDADAKLIQSIPLDRFVTDSEPVGDGSILYLAGYAAPQRLIRQGSGAYALDAAWVPDRYPFAGGWHAAAGLFVDSDAAGNVYYADGYWASGNHTVVQYDPTGRFITRFGALNSGVAKGGSWAAGDFWWALGGVAVSPDGRRILTTEAGNNRVQIWKRDPGAITFTTNSSVGGTQANNADRQGYCNFSGWEGKFAAPYDVNLDAAGNVYVINTTCKQVLRFNPDLTALTANLDVRMPDGADIRPHGFAVGADGTVFVGENRRVLIPNESDADTPSVPVRSNEPIPEFVCACTPPLPSAPSAFQPPVWPTAGMRSDLTANFTLRRPMMRRTAKRQLVYGTVRCNTRCTIAVEARAGRKLLGTYRATWSGAARSVVINLPRRRVGKQLTFSIVATAAGNTPVRRSRVYAISA